MADSPPSTPSLPPGTPTDPAPIAPMKVSKPRRISVVWLAPVFAALAVGYLAFDVLSRRGPMISVTFNNAQGIIERKTPLKFEGVDVGMVEDLDVDFATGAITFHVRLHADAAAIAREGSQFWIQNPEISLLGVNALDTLISGPYVACLAGQGASATTFQGRSQSPPPLLYRPGLRISLRADELGSLEAGSVVLYRGLNVGIGGIRRPVRERGSTATGPICLSNTLYASLVRPDSSFWEVSGRAAECGFETGPCLGHAEPPPGPDRCGGLPIPHREPRRTSG